LLSYEDTKYLLQQKLQRRQGTVSEQEVQECVDEFMDLKAASTDFDQIAHDTEEARLLAYLIKRIVPTFGHVPLTRPDGVERLLCANLTGWQLLK
jgi:hypothetical protein